MESVRLQKFFTDCGILSRRAAEEEIRNGNVTVNGEIADIGQKIDPVSDVVAYRGKVIKPPATEKHYILLYKPRGIVTTLSDEKGRTTVADLVADVGTRLYPVGRLDMDSDGLLLLTDDGALTERLTHPRHEIPKRYHVTVAGVVTPAQLAALGNSFLLDGYATRPVKVSVVRAEGGETVLCFELYEGRNRQIRRMCDQVALRIRRLTRVAIGKIGIGDLVPGRYRHLTPEEVLYLQGEDGKTKQADKKTPTPKKTRTSKPKNEDAKKVVDTEKEATDTAKTTKKETASKRSATQKVLDALNVKHVTKAIKELSAKATKTAKERVASAKKKAESAQKDARDDDAPHTPHERQIRREEREKK